MQVSPEILRGILSDVWGYDDFKPQQIDIISMVTSGKDVLALLPTGGGKSICFQVPGLALGGLTVVISPLISLIEDQVKQLKDRGISAHAFVGEMSASAFYQVLDMAQAGSIKFLYLSPERATSKRFLERLPHLGVTLLAIDEAHCVSQWGHDFRPSYQRLTSLRNRLAEQPCIALTASATPMVLKDLQSSLGMDKATCFRASFERPNLLLNVSKVPSRGQALVERIASSSGRQIVYCRSRRQVTAWTQTLNASGHKALPYHAGLSAEVRRDHQAKWQEGSHPAMVATTAFGMGIDQPDVRLVVHLDWPESLEGYYQEIGRAGRDGRPSESLLLMDKQSKSLHVKRQGLTTVEWEEAMAVYHCLASSSLIGQGDGMGNRYSLDLSHVQQASGLNRSKVMLALLLFEREGLMLLDEHWQSQPMVKLLVQAGALVRLAEEFPAQKDLLYAVSRGIPGIAQNHRPIQLASLATTLQRSQESVMMGLIALHDRGIIDYEPDDAKYYVKWLHGRSPIGHLPLSKSLLMSQNSIKRQRHDSVTGFFSQHTTCRFNLLLRYFGEKPNKPCGQCDPCLTESSRSSMVIQTDILQLLSAKALTGNAIIATMSDVEVAVKEALIAGLERHLWLVNDKGFYSLP
ncbi:MAG: RecQ family ATP-dependent DNA helicase [Proteobacteria bacterium]|nr:RecQ family ATP-dependent DNA helicase [Pseudomonadota bacterium]